MSGALPDDAVAALDGVALCALRAVGKWLLRGKRERYRQLGSLPLHRAHTVWPLAQFNAERALVGQLDAVPILMARWAPGLDGALIGLHLGRYLAGIVVKGQLYDPGAMRSAIEAKL